MFHHRLTPSVTGQRRACLHAGVVPGRFAWKTTCLGTCFQRIHVRLLKLERHACTACLLPYSALSGGLSQRATFGQCTLAVQAAAKQLITLRARRSTLRTLTTVLTYGLHSRNHDFCTTAAISTAFNPAWSGIKPVVRHRYSNAALIPVSYYRCNVA